MADADTQPFPPGDYPAVIVGSGPGGIQASYELRRLGVEHAFITADPAAGGMFRHFPVFQRLITWSRPHAPVSRDTPEYYRFDWNSMVTDDRGHAAPVAEFMDGTSYFPARAEIETGLTTFVQRAGLPIRYGCSWQGTSQVDGKFVLHTTDGDYRCEAAVFAIGMTEKWYAPIPGIEDAPHYVDMAQRSAPDYRGKRVFIIGKRNSGFELADGLLPWTSQLILGSPHPIKPSITTGVPTPPRARYVQPVEDSQFGGGTLVVDCAIERVERTASGYRVHTQGTTKPGEMIFDVDEVIAATGFGTPMMDLPALGVTTFYKNRLPSQTAYWESTSLPGIYFAGSVTQGHAGLRKYGFPSRSASIAGFRYNSIVLAEHLARTRFGVRPPVRSIASEKVVEFLLAEAARGPAVWSQMSHLARVVIIEKGTGIHDEGVLPLAPFVDSAGPDGVAITVETDPNNDIHPAVYLRRAGKVEEILLGGNPMHDFETSDNRRQLADALKPMLA